MLSSSGCDIELDPTEVVMNQLMIPHSDSDDVSMHLLWKDTKITMTSTETKGFQFVLESTCGFVGGSCDDDRRVAGREGEDFSLTTDLNEECIVTGGWATGQEAVRLVAPLRITSDMLMGKPKGEMKTEVNSEERIRSNIQADSEQPKLSRRDALTLSSSYYYAMLFVVIATWATIHLCRRFVPKQQLE